MGAVLLFDARGRIAQGRPKEEGRQSKDKSPKQAITLLGKKVIEQKLTPLPIHSKIITISSHC